MVPKFSLVSQEKGSLRIDLQDITKPVKLRMFIDGKEAITPFVVLPGSTVVIRGEELPWAK